MSLRVLYLRFDAPLMSFGGIVVDENNPTEKLPGQAMITGLLGNALGYDHSDFDALQRLQERLRYGVRRDRRGERMQDFQTVDLGQDFLRQGWTTRDAPQARAGGSARTGTHIRYRWYWADAVFTVALTLDPVDESPTLEQCAEALDHPERPLFLGRKTCLPSRPIRLGEIVDAESLYEALRRAPIDESPTTDLLAWWPENEGPSDRSSTHRISVVDERDWANQIHVGRRFLHEGRLTLEAIDDPS